MRTVETMLKELNEARAILAELDASPMPLSGLGEARRRFAKHTAESVIAEVAASGCIPDKQAHQFYPTPEKLARICVDLANIGPEHTVLEPSAGRGGIADLLPKERTTCVELSPLHCAILKAKGLNAECADFLAWAEAAPKFDRVVMNPPFSDGRAKLHLETAASLVKPGGVLVAVLPASMRGKQTLGGFSYEWSAVFDNEFAGTSAAVVILKATRGAA